MKTAFLRLTVALAAAVVPLMAIAQESGVTISVDSGAFCLLAGEQEGLLGRPAPKPARARLLCGPHHSATDAVPAPCGDGCSLRE